MKIQLLIVSTLIVTALSGCANHQKPCEDLRYYRDGYDTICKGDDKPIGERKDQP